MRIAIYGPFNTRLYGLLHLTSRGIVPEPLGLGKQKEEGLRNLERIMRHYRMPGHDDRMFMEMLPQLLRGKAVLLKDGQVPSPGFDDLPDDEDEDDEAARYAMGNNLPPPQAVSEAPSVPKTSHPMQSQFTSRATMIPPRWVKPVNMVGHTPLSTNHELMRLEVEGDDHEWPISVEPPDSDEEEEGDDGQGI